MEDYNVTHKRIKSRANQADASHSPALSLSKLFNRKGFIKAGETAKDYTRSALQNFPNGNLTRSKQNTAATRKPRERVAWRLLISRGHCNELRYIYSFMGGEKA